MSTKPKIKRWIEVDPIYLTDNKKKPLEAFVFLNHCRINLSAKTPVLRRSNGFQTLTADSPDGISEALLSLLERRNVRLLAEGLSANDYRKLPREVRNPPKAIVRGTARIYERI